MNDNQATIAEWNGPLGQRWVDQQSEIDSMLSAFGLAAMEVARPRAGELVLDVGCGAGETCLQLACAAPDIKVTGVDVSVQLLELAQQRLNSHRLANVSLLQADASSSDKLPQQLDLIFSRFGVMFFSDPAAAFAHLRGRLRTGGRACFVCWQSAQENPWGAVPVAAARAELGLPAPKLDPEAPGPSSFADERRVRRILQASGFARISVEPFEAPIRLGSSARLAAESAARSGALERVVRNLPAGDVERGLAAAAAALAPLAAADGSVSLPGRSWIVSAS